MPLISPELERELAPLCALEPRVAVVLGSGHGGFIDRLQIQERLEYAQLPEFNAADDVPGHAGELIVGMLDGVRVAAFSGRFHYYQGLQGPQVVLPVLAAHAMGIERLVLTCACGVVNLEWEAGDIVFISDQVNLQGRNPLIELQRLEPQRERFVDMSRAYSLDPAAELIEAGRAAGVRVHVGTVAALLGPSYETPAEIRMIRTMGVDAVTMSTVPEALVAQWLGMRLVALGLVANKAASDRGPGLSHAMVLDSVRRSAPAMHDVLSKAIQLLSQ
ncbi:MAG: purine-nucleoside phosphorylase [Candidatus Alcyoniella australis]|nr:purine-nucleoside phosphorylase [Candidatus Alcyoniella australis]